MTSVTPGAIILIDHYVNRAPWNFMDSKMNGAPFAAALIPSHSLL